MIPATSHNPRLARQLARMVGLFGERAWPEIEVVDERGERLIMPVPEETAKTIQYVRKMLREDYHLEPITE